MQRKRIAFIPIDNRPVCYTLPEQIAKIDNNLELLLPDSKFLGDLKKTADVENILVWLEKVENVNSIIISLDTLAYGGLIPSRRSPETLDEIKTSLEKLKQILKNKKAKVYAFSSIMRISNNNINEEEKEYWNPYGKEIFEYSFKTHKFGEAKTKVPKEIIDDYIKTRKRNFEINRLYLDWQREGLFETLVFSKDDCAEYGLNVQEAKALGYLIEKNNLNALIKTGADEIPLSLLSRALTEDKNIKIHPKFTHPNYVNKISKYEDISVIESVKGQIELAGCEVSDENTADIILIVNNFKEEQGELVMGVETESFGGELELPDKPYILADILNANGADNDFVEKFLAKEIDFKCFLGYAGWNTTGNTMGSALCCALAKFLASDYNEEAFKTVQLVRFIDDWAYQANIRKVLKETFTSSDETTLKELKKLMKPYEDILNNKFKTQDCLSYNFPWGRFFEIGVNEINC